MSEEVLNKNLVIPEEAKPLIEELNTISQLPEETKKDERVTARINEINTQLKEIETNTLKKLNEKKEDNKEKTEKVEKIKKEKKNIVTPLGNFEISDNENEEDEDNTDYEKWENVVKTARQNGLDIEKPKDLKKVFSMIKEKENKIKEYEPQINELKSTKETLENLIANLPLEIKNPFIAWANNDPNWKDKFKEVAETPFDLTQPVEKLDVRKLVNYFSNENYTEDDWEDLEDRTKNTLTKNATEMYRIKQHGFASYVDTVKQNNEKKRNNFMASVDNTIDKLKKENPNLKENELRTVKEKLLNPNDYLFEKDGTYKEDAAKKIANALYAEQTIGALYTELTNKTRQAEKIGITKGREDVLLKGKDKPLHTNTETMQDVIKNKVEKETTYLKLIQ